MILNDSHKAYLKNVMYLKKYFFIVAASLILCACGDVKNIGPHIQFSQEIISPAPSSNKKCCTDIVALGDINGDGLPDVLIGSENAGKNGLVWYQAPQWKMHPVANGDFTTDGQLWDMDGDKDLDIVVSTQKEGIFWFENQLGGVKWAPHKITKLYAHDLELGDVDNDGDVDMVMDDKKHLFLFLQDKGGEWQRISVASKAGEGLALADLDNDGDLDIIHSAIWYEMPDNPRVGAYRAHVIDSTWPADTKVRVADLDNDGRRDVVLSVSEGQGKLAWYKNPIDITTASWSKKIIENDFLTGAHSLQIADMDNDGDWDIVTAEMHTSPKKRVLVYINDEGRWIRQILATTGSHNIRLRDIDNDGDVDIVGKNYGGKGRAVMLWVNQTRTDAERLSLDNWQYHTIDNQRPLSEARKTGLVAADVNHDDLIDVVAGGVLYLNRLSDRNFSWERILLPGNVDIFFAESVDDDKYADFVGFAGDKALWLEASDDSLKNWEVRTLSLIPKGRTQGYEVGQLIPGGKRELIFTRGKGLYYFSIPEKKLNVESWDLQIISNAVEEEGIDVADIDRDGDMDIVAHDHADGKNLVVWFEHTTKGENSWLRHILGYGEKWLDRIAVADVNQDGRVDIVSSEETQDLLYNANIYWFEAPEMPTDLPWKRHKIATLRSVNSLNVKDMDNDGDMDIIAAEHTDFSHQHAQDDNLTAIYENKNNGQEWLVHEVDRGPRSSHLGALTTDIDGDGDLDIISIAWQQSDKVHLWVNQAPNRIARIAP